MRLDFLVPGFAKCGSTTLCALLADHPGIFMPAQKDFRLFDLPDYQRRWDEWERRFAPATRAAAIGDGSIWYTDASTEEDARRRILEHFPEVKLLFIARDPIDRIDSAFRELHHSGTDYAVTCPFDLGKALQAFPNLLDGSCYAQRLDNYRRAVPADRLLVLLLEDLVAHPEDVLARCFTFLGVDATVRIADVRRRLNPRGAKYHDSKRLRELRRDPAAASALARIPGAVQSKLLPGLRLRHAFADAPLEWSPEARRLVREHVADDARRFLADHGRPPELWPRLAAVLEERDCHA